MFFDEDDFRKKSKQPKALSGERYSSQQYTNAAIEWFTQETLNEEVGGKLSFDMETYPNYYCACFKSFKTGRVLAIEVRRGGEANDNLLLWIIHNFELAGFNNHWFDDVLMWAIISGKSSTDEIYEIVKYIIPGGGAKGPPPWIVAKKFGFKIQGGNSVDLINVCPLKASLKLYGGRLHFKRMQDLPYKPGTELTPEQQHNTLIYCINDLDVNTHIYNKLTKQIDLRIKMGVQYGIDLRSKSDAQIAEYVIKSEVEKIAGRKIYAPEIEPGTRYSYFIPSYLNYSFPQLNEALEVIRNASFEVGYSGHVQMPSELSNYVININDKKYKLGIGGLHSQENKVSYKATEELLIVDRDVASYYPAIILNQGLAPSQMGEEFIDVYRNIVETRLDAKMSGNKAVADSLKIVINSSFGKFGNAYSSMYSPQMVIQVTLTGQLLLLLLIDMFESNGFEVISANTDGVVTLVPVERKDLFNSLCDEWVKLTKLNINDRVPVLEETPYSAYYGRDVNNYIAVKTNGKTKGKGAYTNPYFDGEWNFALQKNPQNSICIEAAIALITNGTPIEDTVKSCQDIKKFVTVRNVTGGGYKDNILIGKTVRWYYKKDELGFIETPKGNMVPKSRGAWPLLELVETIPEDLDYQWYIQETKYILLDIGYYNRPRRKEALGFKITKPFNDYNLDDEIPF